MATNNSLIYAVKSTGEFIKDIVYFPLWWYSRGLKQTTLSIINFLSNREKSLALFIWIKNIFVPMYGEYNWQGRLISFFMRLVQIIIRGIIMIFWLSLCLIILLIWLALPIFVIYQILYQTHVIDYIKQ